MVSLSKLMSVDEQGVNFESPHTGEQMSLPPEMSIEIQQALDADIMMQLDHVVHVLTTGGIVEEAMQRSIRWLDRCEKAHTRPDQALFPIVQGGLNLELRKKCVEEMAKRAKNFSSKTTPFRDRIHESKTRRTQVNKPIFVSWPS
ncbi:hypothetical protein Y032_0043g790 [Ancylostoma ceylanicum]|nr:hypothetical protein Y032_0043g790 [Ancylostoma ceylanicum]